MTTRAFRPTSLSEALAILSDVDLGAVPVAGCTDLLVVDHASGRRHQAVVDLLSIPELKGVREQGDWIDYGAATTFTQLREHALTRAYVPVLAEMAATVGAWQIQNRATLGGNIANASPAGDSLPVLLALGAELVVAGKNGERTLAYDDVHVGYRKTALAFGELIVRVRVPKGHAELVTRFSKVGTRAAQAISKVVVAMRARRDGAHLKDVRIAAGSVAAVPTRLFQAEAAVEGNDPKSCAEHAAALAAKEVHPIDDVRSSAAYRRFVLARVVRRMVISCHGRA